MACVFLTSELRSCLKSDSDNVVQNSKFDRFQVKVNQCPCGLRGRAANQPSQTTVLVEVKKKVLSFLLANVSRADKLINLTTYLYIATATER